MRSVRLVKQAEAWPGRDRHGGARPSMVRDGQARAPTVHGGATANSGRAGYGLARHGVSRRGCQWHTVYPECFYFPLAVTNSITYHARMSTAIKKPAKYKLKSAMVLWSLGHRIKDSRLRQLAREHNIGYLEFDSTPDGFTSPKATRWFCKADIMTIVSHCKSLKKQAENGELDISEKLKKIT